MNKDTHWIENPIANSLNSTLRDLMDVRNALSDKIKNKPKDNDGTETTIGDCLDDAIATINSLNSIDPDISLVVYEAAWFAFRHHYQDLADYLDLSDDVLQPIMEKLDKQLNGK
jgi:hypothetical protein